MEGQYQVKRAGSDEIVGSGGKCDVRTYGVSDGVMVIADPRDASASKKYLNHTSQDPRDSRDFKDRAISGLIPVRGECYLCDRASPRSSAQLSPVTDR